MRFTLPSLKRPPERGRPRGRRRFAALGTGCLATLALSLLLSWLSLRWIRPPGSESGRRRLSWPSDLGARAPAGEEPTRISLGPLLGAYMTPSILSVQDAAEREREWILLDRRLGMIHYLDVASGSVRSLGGEGPGPGELQDPVAMALTETHLWILNQRGLVLDRFSPAGDFETRRRIHGGACLVGLPKNLRALGADTLLLLRVCPPSLPGPGTAWVELVTHEGELKPILSLALDGPGSRRLHLFRQPALAAGFGRLFLGTWDAPCIAELLPDGAGAGHRCMPDFARAETPSGEQEKIRRRLARLPNLGLLPIEVPDRFPWYDRLFAISRGLVLRRIRGDQDRDLILLMPDGGASLVDHLLPETTFVGERTLLSARSLLNGTLIEVFQAPWG